MIGRVALFIVDLIAQQQSPNAVSKKYWSFAFKFNSKNLFISFGIQQQKLCCTIMK